MNYKDAINAGFKLFDKIENELIIISRQSDQYCDISYSNGILKIEADYGERNVEAKIAIDRIDVMKKMYAEHSTPEQAIYNLIEEKICMAAHEVK